MQQFCLCSMCGAKYINGTVWCFDNCWLPLTWLGVHQRINHISIVNDPMARVRELRAIYGIDMKELQAKLDAPGSAVCALPRGTFTAVCVQHGLQRVAMAPVGSEAAAKRQRLSTKTKASGPPPQPPPAMAARRVVSASAVLTPRGSAAASSSSGPGATARCAHSPTWSGVGVSCTQCVGAESRSSSSPCFPLSTSRRQVHAQA